MDDDTTNQSAEASAPTLRTPPTLASGEAKPKRVRKPRAAKRGPKPMSDAEKRERAEARAKAEADRAEQERQQAQARQQIARAAAIGALSPDLLTDAEIAALSRFALAMLRAQEQRPTEQGQ